MAPQVPCQTAPRERRSLFTNRRPLGRLLTAPQAPCQTAPRERRSLCGPKALTPHVISRIAF